MREKVLRTLRRESTSLIVLGALFAIVLARGSRGLIAGYGDNGAEFNEHSSRLAWLLHIRSRLAEADPPGLLELLRQLESGFPPGLYALGTALSPIVGHDAEHVGPALAGVSVVVLMVSVGIVAWRITGSGRVVRAAVVGTALLPAVHGSSLRYYFDLPMTAVVWAAVAVLAWGDGSRPLLRGVLGGLLAVLACLIKWTALPFLLPMVLGLMLSPDRPNPGRSRRLAGVAMAVVLSLGVVGYLAAVGTPNSLLAMAQESSVADLSGDEGGAQDSLGGIPSLVLSTLRHLVEPGYERQLTRRAVFYGLGLVFSMCSPLLAALALFLAVRWFRRGRPGWRFLVATVLGQGLFLMLWVRPADERFLLTMAPALVLVAASGWESFERPARRRLAWAVIVVGLLVGLDFHHFPVTSATPSTVLLLHNPDEAQAEVPLGPMALRGLGAASSVEQRGWSRADEGRLHRTELRDAVQEWLLNCRPPSVAAESSAPLISPRGDHAWLEYIELLARVEGRVSGTVGVRTVDCAESGDLPAGTVLMTQLNSPEAPRSGFPACLAQGGWFELQRLPDPAGGTALGLWTQDPNYRCPRN